MSKKCIYPYTDPVTGETSQFDTYREFLEHVYKREVEEEDKNQIKNTFKFKKRESVNIDDIFKDIPKESLNKTLDEINEIFNTVKNDLTSSIQLIKTQNPIVLESFNAMKRLSTAKRFETIETSKVLYNTIIEYGAILQKLSSTISNVLSEKDPSLTNKNKWEIISSAYQFSKGMYLVNESIIENLQSLGLENTNPIFKFLENNSGYYSTIDAKYRSYSAKYLSNLLYEQYGVKVKSGEAMKELIKPYEKALEKAKKRLSEGDEKAKKFIDEYEKKIANYQKRQITPEFIEEVILGMHKDSNYFSHYFEMSLLNSDPIIAPFSKIIHEKIIAVRERYIKEVANVLQTANDEYDKRHHNKNNLREYNKNLYEWVTIKKIDYSDPSNLKLKEEYKELQLNKWFDYEYLNVITEFELEKEIQLKKLYKVKDEIHLLKNKKNLTQEDLKNIDLLQNEQKKITDDYNNVKERFLKWKLDNLEQKYTSEYYDILKSIEKTHIYDGQLINISEILENMDRDIYSLERDLIENYSLEKEIELTNLEIEKRNLYSLKNTKGEDKTGRELFIAEKLQEYQQLKKDLYEEYTEEDRAIALDRFQKHKNNFEADIRNKVLSGLNTEEEALMIRKRWYLRNTKTKISEKFYEQRNVLLNQLPESNLYEKLFKETGVFKDSENIELGHLYNKKQKEKIKKILLDIEKYKKENKSSLEEKEIYKKLSQLQERVTTDYYEKTYEEQYEIFKNLYINKFTKKEKESFDKKSIKEQNKELKKEFVKSDWYQENHYQIGKYYRPLNIWTQVVPKNKDYILKEEPSFKYYDRKVKNKYLNPNYEIDGLTGQVLPKRNGRYDKTSSSFAGPSERKNFNLSLEDKKVLSTMIEIHQKSQNHLTYGERLGYAVPRKEKTTTDKISEGKIADIMTIIQRSFGKTEQDKELGILDGSKEMSKSFNYLPVRMTSEIKDSEISYDIWGAIAQFSHHALLREQLKIILPESQALLSLLKDEKNYPTSSEIKNKSNGILRTLTPFNTGRNIRAEHVEEIIKTLFFNEQQKVDNSFSLYAHKAIGTLNGITALSTIAWNIPSSIVNWSSANVQMLIESAGNEYISFKDVKKATTITYSKYYKQFIQDWASLREGNKSTIGQIIDYWGVIQEGVEENAGKNLKKTYLKNFLETSFYSMSLREMGEHHAQVSLFFAMMEKKYVSYKGEIMTLLKFYEKLNNELGFLSVRNLENGLVKEITLDKNNKIIEEKDWTYNDEKNYMLLINNMNVNLNGNYKKINKTVAEKEWYFAAILFFRKYLVPLASRRFKGGLSPRLDIIEDGYREGYYITLWKLLKMTFWDNVSYKNGGVIKDLPSNVIEMINMMIQPGKKGSEYFNNHQVSNLRRMNMEIALVVSFTLLVKLLTNLDGDNDDDEDQFLLLHTLYLIKKLKSETEMYLPGMNLKEARQLFTTPSIGLKYFFNIQDYAETLPYMIFNEDARLYKRDTSGFWKKGDSKMLAQSLRFIGFNGKTFYPKALIEGLEYAQNRR